MSGSCGNTKPQRKPRGNTATALLFLAASEPGSRTDVNKEHLTTKHGDMYV